MRTVEQRQIEVLLKKLRPQNSKFKVFGWDVFIPVFDNEDLINNFNFFSFLKLKLFENG